MPRGACPGGSPASPFRNGGAFGGKLHSPVADDARRLADEHGRPVRVLWSREDVVRRGPKRPPVGAGIAADGTGVLRVGISGGPVDDDRWAAVVRSVAAVAPGLALEQVAVDGPPVSFDLRAAVWAEAAVLAAAVRLAPDGRSGAVAGDRVPVEVVAPGGGRAVVRCWPDGSLDIEVAAGPGTRRRRRCAPTPSGPPTRRSAGWAPRGSPWPPTAGSRT